uniref:Uncharacterized protein n=1 Tax=Candidatus Kentrum sp. FW TaxID=2126338 RepID=A0A450SUD4_9GAMM|nr:MAG: hypothetical protein BECKFW1821B_GA0114236_103512 [Candidatus Kentron sp. FW]
MFIKKLEWDEYRINHILRHDVEPEEVWDVCNDPLHLARRQGHSRYLVYGRTVAGRYLFVVLEHGENMAYKPITARDMTHREKQNFRRLRR